MLTNAARLALILIAAACAAIGLVGCNAHTPSPDAETVGTLSSVDGSSYRAPVHATTDLTPSFAAPNAPAATPDDDGFTVTPAEDLPEVAPKSDGITMGQVRQ